MKSSQTRQRPRVNKGLAAGEPTRVKEAVTLMLLSGQRDGPSQRGSGSTAHRPGGRGREGRGRKEGRGREVVSGTAKRQSWIGMR